MLIVEMLGLSEEKGDVKNYIVQGWSIGCSSKRLFWPLVSVSGYMVRLGEWSQQKKFQRYRPINDPLPAT